MTKQEIKTEKVAKKIRRGSLALLLSTTCLAILSISISACKNTEAEEFSCGLPISNNIEIKDTTALYNINFYSRISEPVKKRRDLVVKLIVTSPKNISYEDYITLSLIPSNSATTMIFTDYYRDYEWKYRHGVRFPIKGNWSIQLVQQTVNNNYTQVNKFGIKIDHGER